MKNRRSRMERPLEISSGSEVVGYVPGLDPPEDRFPIGRAINSAQKGETVYVELYPEVVKILLKMKQMKNVTPGDYK